MGMKNMEAVLIKLFSPNCNVDSAEDSGDANGGGILDNLSGIQLQGGASVVYRNGLGVGEIVDPEEDPGSS